MQARSANCGYQLRLVAVEHQLNAQGSNPYKQASEQLCVNPTLLTQPIGNATNLTLYPFYIQNLHVKNHKRKNGLASGANTANYGNLAFVAIGPVPDLVSSSGYNPQCSVIQRHTSFSLRQDIQFNVKTEMIFMTVVVGQGCQYVLHKLAKRDHIGAL